MEARLETRKYLLLLFKSILVHSFSQGFFFPEDVAYKIGPEDTLEYAVLEIHYDNQKKTAGMFYLSCALKNVECKGF